MRLSYNLLGSEKVAFSLRFNSMRDYLASSSLAKTQCHVIDRCFNTNQGALSCSVYVCMTIIKHWNTLANMSNYIVWLLICRQQQVINHGGYTTYTLRIFYIKFKKGKAPHATTNFPIFATVQTSKKFNSVKRKGVAKNLLCEKIKMSISAT